MAPLLLLTACPGDKAGEEGGEEEWGPEEVDLDGDGWFSVEDCDDQSAAIYPGADEVCNGLDDDCDGTIDDDPSDATPYYLDDDGDGWGSELTEALCAAEDGYTDTTGDCDDGSAEISPDATETCDGVDNDCDMEIDEEGATGGAEVYLDQDEDGYGHPARTAVLCEATTGYSENNLDCDDEDPARNPDATEDCTDGEDNDCDGAIDESDDAETFTWFIDADGDGYGSPEATTEACALPDGYSATDDDCDDADADVNPGAGDRDDGLDNDCDGEIDEGGAGTNTGWLIYTVSARAETLCTLWWDTAWTETSGRGCDDCEWTWEVLHEGNVGRSEGTAFCGEPTEIVWELGLDLDYESLDAEVMWYYWPEYRYWIPVFYAYPDLESGTLTFAWVPAGYGHYEYYAYEYASLSF